MNLKTKTAIANALIELSEKVEGKTGSLKWALCYNFEKFIKKQKLTYDERWDAFEWLENACTEWPKYSGNYSYPVPAPQSFVFDSERQDIEGGGDGNIYSKEERADFYFQEVVNYNMTPKKMYQFFWGYHEYGSLRRELLAYLLERIAKEL